MDGTQMDSYYSEELLKLRFAIDDLARINWTGLFHWLSAKRTWTTPPLEPAQLESMREHANALLESMDKGRR